ncbi:aminotransferase class IV [Micromonospora mangrovi]|uniref:Aminotransferase class IV n=2 Tax=Micromonospora TaxID=1873 RepID=A0AAU8HFT7_9ACTN
MPPATRVTPLLLWETEIREGFEDSRYRPVVADSWLLQHGMTRGYRLHWRRFCSAVQGFGVPARRVARFGASVTTALPRSGVWFPRIELHLGPTQRLALRLRPAPPLGIQARGWLWPHPDPRRLPHIKGPDFEELEKVRAAAHDEGADEALLLDDTGLVREGAFSSIYWWASDALHTPPNDGRILPGVTRELILARCAELGIPVRYRLPSVAELLDSEVWITSALHGIRVLTHINGRPTAPPQERRLHEWRAHLDALKEPIPDPEAIWPHRSTEEAP